MKKSTRLIILFLGLAILAYMGAGIFEALVLVGNGCVLATLAMLAYKLFEKLFL